MYRVEPLRCHGDQLAEGALSIHDSCNITPSLLPGKEEFMLTAVNRNAEQPLLKCKGAQEDVTQVTTRSKFKRRASLC